ncbi:MAG TPA: hypothetical protein VIP77_21655 [Jiangellaceae bacterium]
MEIEFITRPGASPDEEVVQVRLECASPQVLADRLVDEARRAGERLRHRLRMSGAPIYVYVLIARKSAA